MIEILVAWILSALALMVSSHLFKRVELEGGFFDALWVAAIYAVLSFLLGWLIFGLLGVATLGLGFVFGLVTKLVTAAIVLKLTGALSSRFSIHGFLPALATAAALALASEATRLTLERL